jgi:hypothetical protein
VLVCKGHGVSLKRFIVRYRQNECLREVWVMEITFLLSWGWNYGAIIVVNIGQLIRVFFIKIRLVVKGYMGIAPLVLMNVGINVSLILSGLIVCWIRFLRS